MAKSSKTFADVMSGKRDANIRFSDLQGLLIDLGFRQRTSGDHFIYKRSDIPERAVIQPDGSKAKAYQVKQVRQLINKYSLEV